MVNLLAAAQLRWPLELLAWPKGWRDELCGKDKKKVTISKKAMVFRADLCRIDHRGFHFSESRNI
ncbi:hypothetical protein [Azotobacter beijerinckii]|uniref:hypothetical protein n=1 Tax=Azotobacter beijerinckii TaxID=170623 RepID=UPI001114297C|nr:hypothetical protein [Azotobacter beijerinckii]